MIVLYGFSLETTRSALSSSSRSLPSSHARGLCNSDTDLAAEVDPWSWGAMQESTRGRSLARRESAASYGEVSVEDYAELLN